MSNDSTLVESADSSSSKDALPANDEHNLFLRYNILGNVVLILLIYQFARYLMLFSCSLDESNYSAFSFLLQIPFAGTKQLVLLLAVCLYSASNIRLKWSDIGQENKFLTNALRLLMSVAAFTLCWTASTYPYNYYYDKLHLIDRLFVGILWGGFVFRPGIAPLLLFVVVCSINQFDPLFGTLSWTDKLVPTGLLLIFLSALLLRTIGKQTATGHSLLICFLLLVSSHYFIPGLGKLEIRWWEHARIYNIIYAAYQNGWLASLDETQFHEIVKLVKPWNGVMVVFTLIVEVGAMFVFFSKRIAIFLCAGWSMLHIGIFIFSGICFWKWLMVDLSMLVTICYMPLGISKIMFGFRQGLVMLVLILTSWYTLKPVNLAWFDTQVVHTYQFELTGKSGVKYNISKSFFKPYALVFSQNRLGFLSNQNLLTGTYGMTIDPQLADLLSENKINCQDLIQLKKYRLEQMNDEARTNAFEKYISTYFHNINKNIRFTHSRNYPYLTGFPLHIWTFSKGNDYNFQEIITKVDIYLLTTISHDNNTEVCSRILLDTVSIPQ
ncbi:hypothetical protein [uncultured Rubinisphaera sp.]|uniref:hypothetical protein n=1 Tax=uncultured Rubinisphaera sp. TaxID=1678686 RepID=UPI0030DB7131|tara:strand:- start:864 stop:2519 length:1656 start_codon:yes stop_codon:yes gene_type:complete